MATRRSKKAPPSGGGGADWALTYGDMMTLLMTFFILIVSFSTTELVKFRKAMGSLRGSMGVLLEQDGASIIAKENDSVLPKMDSHVTMQSLEDLEKYVFEMQIENGVGIELREGGLTIRLADYLLFDLGQVEVKPVVYPILDNLGMLIQMMRCKVRVEGHTDNLPIHTGRFKSNWMLSVMRAVSVVDYFVEKVHLDPTLLSAVGCGEFRPLLPNTTAENRAQNRRVEIVLDFEDLPPATE